jgi:predicted amidohydrolase YtcJ
MARQTKLGRELLPGERIGLDAAMRMFTADAAWACHLDDRGVLASGKLADLVILGENRGRPRWTTCRASRSTRSGSAARSATTAPPRPADRAS